jgi:hypothetical protein
MTLARLQAYAGKNETAAWSTRRRHRADVGSDARPAAVGSYKRKQHGAKNDREQ